MKWHVTGSVHAGKYLGAFDADTGEEAIQKAMDKNGFVSVCHHCSAECSDPEIGEVTAESDDGTVVTENAPPTWEEQARAAGWMPPKPKRARKAPMPEEKS